MVSGLDSSVRWEFYLDETTFQATLPRANSSMTRPGEETKGGQIGACFEREPSRDRICSHDKNIQG
jgi:hypothetical protein